MSTIGLCSVVAFIYMEMMIKESVAFVSWQEPPIMSCNGSGQASVIIKENHAVNTSTGIQLKVEGRTGDIVYFMRYSHNFSVDSGSGKVFLKSALDYEKSSSIKVLISAVDDGKYTIETCTATMTVRIADVNDNRPYFVKSYYRTSVLDSLLEESPVIQLNARDDDRNDTIIYSAADSSSDSDFYVDTYTGLIKVARPLMAFRRSSYFMIARAVDGGVMDSVSFTATVSVIITVIEDINKTRCEPTEVTMNVSTDLKIGETVPVDIRCSNWVRHSPFFVLDASDQQFHCFNIRSYRNKMPYLITTSSIPNSTLQGRLVVYDGSPKGNKINTARLIINPVEMNDAPTITPLSLSVDISENTIVGTAIGIFTVHDPDHGEWGAIRVYSLDKPDSIDIGPVVGDTVELVITSTLDVDIYKGGYRRMENYVMKFNVVVSDNLGLSTTSVVYLNVTDVNDNAPICSPSSIVKRYPKNVGNYTRIVSLSNICNDADLSIRNSNLSYRIETDSCSAFNIVGDSIFTPKMPLTQESCLIVVNVEDNGIPKSNTQVTIEIKFLECPNDTDYLGIPWIRGVPGEYMFGRCPTGEGRRVKRYCDKDGNYHVPVYNCTRSEIKDIYIKLLHDISKQKAISRILDDLVNETSADNGILLIGDIETVNKILSRITDVATANSAYIENITNAFIEVANNILRESMTITWKVMINKTGSGADTVIDNLDRFVEKIGIATDSNFTTAVYAKTNLLVKIDKNVMCDRGISFPNRTREVVPAWAIHTLDTLTVPCSRSSGQKGYSSALYRTVSELMPSRSTQSISQSAINAPVMSFTYYPKIVGNLESPVEITFQIYDTTMESPSCTFWARNYSTRGSWSVEGCWLHMYDKEKNVVVCKCDHLTNFAVLMSPSNAASSTDGSHYVTLSIISMTGCIISMVCLFLTVVAHVILWKTVKSVRAIIHINLASSLFVAYLLFLFGVNQTENKDVCTAVAVLLHIVYLVVFFIMLTEGLNLAYVVLKPLSTRKPGIPLLIASYVMPVVIVGISMAAVQLDGYASESFCWLSTNTGLIWAFIAPVLFIILVNVIIICLVLRKMCGTRAMSIKTNKEKARAGIRSVFVLMPIMGVTWVLGIFSVNENTVLFQYLFAIFNSLQGLLIFIFHCVMNKKSSQTEKNTTV